MQKFPFKEREDVLWLGEQIKMSLEYEKIKINSIVVSYFSRVIWNIIIDYNCEDPKIVMIG